MAGYQFFHVEVYARVSPAKAVARRWTVREVFAEAGREFGHHPHVVNPRPPVVVFGSPLADVEAAVLAAADNARDAAGRRLRKDTPVLLAGVASFPARADRMSLADRAAYEAWEQDTIAWLRGFYGHRLKAVVRHEDEGHDEKPTYLHLHFFVVPDLDAGERIESVHPGRAAVAVGKASGITERRELNRLYRDAMRRLQDRYHDGVGIRHGLARRGPGRRRLTRAEWLAEQEGAARTATIVRDSREAATRAHEAEREAFRLALDVAQARQQARRMERERDLARLQCERQSGELMAAKSAQQAAELALSSARERLRAAEADAAAQRRRADRLSALLSDARRLAADVATQAAALLSSLLDPRKVELLPRRPHWLSSELWEAIRMRVRLSLVPPLPRQLNRMVTVRKTQRCPEARER